MLLPIIGRVVHTLGQGIAERVAETFRFARTRHRKLRIGVDIRPFYEPLTGVGWYLYFLLHELEKHEGVELYLFGDARITDRGPRLHADVPSSARLCTFDLRGFPESRLARSITAAAYVLWMKIVGCDVMFGANYFLPRLLGAVARRRVITVHDLTYKRFPDLLQKETLDNLERLMTGEIAAADAVICVSESTRQDLLRYYQIDPRRAVTIHSGINIEAGHPHPALRATLSQRETAATADSPLPLAGEGGRRPGEGAEAPLALPSRYILFVSTIEPRKNLTTLLDAFGKLDYPGSLVVVGKIGWKSEDIVDRLQRPRVVHLDYLNAADLAAVYRQAEVFVFPSIYEGFGFPMLEAMAHGVPVIAARSSSLPEVGGEAALYFDPSDSDALARQLERLLGEPGLREEMIARGRERVKQFRWENAAARTLALLRRAAE
jgi:glycosyltransferase involved in cell wall biosynthesis